MQIYYELPYTNVMILVSSVHIQELSLAQKAAFYVHSRLRHVPWRPSHCSCHVQTYIRPKASSKELLMVTRITVACFGMLTGVVAIILFVVGPPDHSRPCMHACATGHKALANRLHEHVTALLTVDTTSWPVS